MATCKRRCVNALKCVFLIITINLQLTAANYESSELIFSTDGLIQTISPAGKDGRVLASWPSATSLAYSCDWRSLFWSDWKTRAVYSLQSGSSQPRLVLPAKSGWWPMGLAVDSVGGKLYVADTMADVVEVFDLRNSNHRVLIDDLSDLQDLDIDVDEGYLFVLDGYQILRTDLAGARHHKVLSEYKTAKGVLDSSNLPSVLRDFLQMIVRPKLDDKTPLKVPLHVVEITLDRKAKRIYWVNSRTRTITSSDYDGASKRVHFQDANDGLDQPDFGRMIAVLDDKIYWADQTTQKIARLDSDGQGSQVILKKSDLNVKSIVAVDCQSHARSYNPCANNNAGCQHLCLRSLDQQSFSCACDVGYELEENGKTCRPIRSYLLFSRYNRLRSLGLDGNGLPSGHVIDPSRFELGSDSLLDFDAEEEIVYYSSMYPGNQLHRIDLESGSRSLLQPDILSSDVYYFALDWTTKNLYYFTHYYADYRSLSVTNTQNPSYSKILLDTNGLSGLITGFALHPNAGFLYFSQDLEGFNTITRMNMDGSGMLVVNKRDNEVTSLAVDYDENRLYWTEQSSTEKGAKTGWIFHSNLNGTDVRKIEAKLTNPSSVAIRGEWIYAVVGNGGNLVRVNRRSGKTTSLYDNDYQLSGLKIYDRQLQLTRSDHPCANGHHCEKFCFAVPSAEGGLQARCACAYGEKLAADGRSCIDNSNDEPPLLPCPHKSYKCVKRDAHY